MDTLWALPSRGRPNSLKRFIGAYKSTHASCTIYLRLDQDDPRLTDYERIRYPGTFTVQIGSRTRAAGAMKEAFELYPDMDAYGFIGDDGVPLTPCWDMMLANKAGKREVAYPDDLLNGESHASHPVVGGDLIRELEWWSLPGLTHLYIDTVWDFIGRSLGVLHYMPNVQIEHRHFSNDKAEWDETYSRFDNGENYSARDRNIFNEWKRNGASECLERLQNIVASSPAGSAAAT